MTSVLSNEEMAILQPHLMGFNACSLAAVIMDAIEKVNHENRVKGCGIRFSNDCIVQFTNKQIPMVTFWDELGVEQQSYQEFLEILQLIGESTINSSSNTSPDQELRKLRLAMKELNRKLSSLEEETEHHKTLSNSIDTCTNIATGQFCSSVSHSLLDPNRLSLSIDSNKIYTCWDDEDDVFLPSSPPLNGTKTDPQSWQSNHIIVDKGMKAVVDRLPELRSRYEKKTSISENKMNWLQTAAWKVLSALHLINENTMQLEAKAKDNTSVIISQSPS